MSTPRSGSCGCGTVRFELDGDVKNVVNCHCSRCRKFNGAAFSTYAVVHKDILRFTAGEEALSRYVLESGAARHYCRHCGTPIYNINPVYGDYRMVHLGAIDQPADLAARMNIFCSTRLEWVAKVDGLPSFQEKFQR